MIVAASQIESVLGRPLTAVEVQALSVMQDGFEAEVQSITGPLIGSPGVTMTISPSSCTHMLHVGRLSAVHAVSVNGETVASSLMSWSPDGTVCLPCCVCPGDVVSLSVDVAAARNAAAVLAWMVGKLAEFVRAHALAGSLAMSPAVTSGITEEHSQSTGVSYFTPTGEMLDAVRSGGAMALHLSSADISWLRRTVGESSAYTVLL